MPVSDIVLDNTEQVAILCDNLKVQGHDFLLDSTPRRSNRLGFRRALVHDQNDGLTLNFGNDYPGGVTITGVRELDVTGNLQFRISHKDAILLGGGHPSDEIVSLSEVIKTLRGEISDLRAQVAKLAKP